MTKSLDHLDLAGHRRLKFSAKVKNEKRGLSATMHEKRLSARVHETRGLSATMHETRGLSAMMHETRIPESKEIPESQGIVKYVHIDHPFHLKNDLTFAFTYADESVSLGSSVCSGLRNSLNSSLESLSVDCNYGDIDIDSSDFGSSSEDSSCIDRREFPSWRLEPEESKSDWTMTIESVPGGNISKYHVHKKVLIHNGRKSSDYFSRLFSDSIIRKRKAIKIHEDAAKLIENMLDFMYSVEDKLQVTSESAVGLRHLSQFFGIRELAKRIRCFINEDISLENMDVYMETSSAFDDFQTSTLCADRCAAEIHNIHPLSPLVAEMDPSFILSIVSSKQFNATKYSEHMSHIMTGYFINQRDAIDGNVFEELTAEEYLPFVDLEAALPLLILESALVEESASESTHLSCLQQRCVEGILPSFLDSGRILTDAERKSREAAMQKVPKKVLVQILSKISEVE